jgi:hypothetical protein
VRISEAQDPETDFGQHCTGTVVSAKSPGSASSTNHVVQESSLVIVSLLAQPVVPE